MPINRRNIDAKLHHAGGYLNAVKAEVKSWMDSNPYSVSKETNHDCTRYSLIFRINKEPPLERWSLVVGDIIFNLRCALDHLTYAIAIHESGQDPPPAWQSLMFPICDTDAKFGDESKRRIKTLSDRVRAAIEIVQPYNRPHEEIPPLLSILRDFNNADKHRLLQLAYSAVSFGNIGFVGPHYLVGTECQPILNFGELKDGAEIAAFVFESPTPNMKYDRIVFDVVIALFHGKKSPSDSVFNERTDFVSLLQILEEEVKTVVEIVLKSVT
jgi:hypothetical protein